MRHKCYVPRGRSATLPKAKNPVFFSLFRNSRVEFGSVRPRNACQDLIHGFAEQLRLAGHAARNHVFGVRNSGQTAGDIRHRSVNLTGVIRPRHDLL